MPVQSLLRFRVSIHSDILKKMKYLSKQEMLIFTKRYRNRKEQNSDNQAESDNVDDDTCVQSYSFKYLVKKYTNVRIAKGRSVSTQLSSAKMINGCV